MQILFVLTLIASPAWAIPAITKTKISLSGQQATLRSRILQSVAAWKSKRTKPGAGLDKVSPFQSVFKDGFAHTACIKDYMFYHGDKFGDHRYEYEIRDTSNVSIVHYAANVPKEDRKAMTQQVCFNFCRTVPDMGFFGILNGRECYCAPFIEAMESDSSDCDAFCEGDETKLGCGGVSKSDVFQMNSCADTANKLKAAISTSKSLSQELLLAAENLTFISDDGNRSADELQKTYGQLGDPTAADLFQKAKERVSVLMKLAKDANQSAKELNVLGKEAESLESDDFTDFTNVKKAETVMASMNTAASEGSKLFERIKSQLALRIKVKTQSHGDDYLVNNSLQYRPAMYFVDKAYLVDQSTCAGELVGDPLFGLFMDECAYACSYQQLDCVAYSHFEDGGICFLFSKLTELTHYSDCLNRSKEEKAADRASSFLQRLSADDAQFQKAMAEEAEYDKQQAVPFAWKTKSTEPDPEGFKAAVNGLCTMCRDCGTLTANATLSDCSLMDTYKCDSTSGLKISEYADDEGLDVIRMEFSGWLKSGKRSSACKINPIPCDQCKMYSTCSGPYAVTNDVQIKKGDVASYTWRSSGATDNYEVFVGLYSAGGELMDYQFQRGRKQEWKTYELISPKTDKYHVKFLLASYDGSGGGAIGADMEIKNVIQTKSSVSRSSDTNEMCVVKYSAFHGMNLRPDPSGQRVGALKKVTKRCLRQRRR